MVMVVLILSDYVIVKETEKFGYVGFFHRIKCVK